LFNTNKIRDIALRSAYDLRSSPDNGQTKAIPA